MPKFKEGDVVRFVNRLRKDGSGSRYAAIVGDPSAVNWGEVVGSVLDPTECTHVMASRWSTGWALNPAGWSYTRDYELHPDAEVIWVEYCAWRLTNA
jgi:hypothetical protein